MTNSLVSDQELRMNKSRGVETRILEDSCVNRIDLKCKSILSQCGYLLKMFPLQMRSHNQVDMMICPVVVNLPRHAAN